MNREADSKTNSEAKPWYAEFWPWFIIVLISSVVVASIATAVLAFKHDDAPAAGSYTREGLGVVKAAEPGEPSR